MKSPKNNHDLLFPGVGNTTLQSLAALMDHPHSDVQLKVKWEPSNLGGASKARAACYMINKLTASGTLQPGQRILVPTSGNTGLACAIVAAAQGLETTLVMSEAVSPEKRRQAEHYGARCILTSAEEGSDGAYRRACEMRDNNADLYLLDQYADDANWMAHYETTGPEIWRQTKGKITHFIAGIGTSGTIIGTGRYLKERNPSVNIIGVQPASAGDLIPGLRNLKFQKVPPIFDPSVIDDYMFISADEAWQTALTCAPRTGLGIGPSGGAAVAAALRLASQLTSGLLVVLVPDGIEKYFGSLALQ